MPPKRRPGASGCQKRSVEEACAAASGTGRWKKAGEIDTDTLLGWPWVQLRGRFRGGRGQVGRQGDRSQTALAAKC